MADYTKQGRNEKWAGLFLDAVGLTQGREYDSTAHSHADKNLI
jgi:hypothetical protein